MRTACGLECLSEATIGCPRLAPRLATPVNYQHRGAGSIGACPKVSDGGHDGRQQPAGTDLRTTGKPQ